MSEARKIQNKNGIRARNSLVEYYPEFSRLLMQRQEEVSKREQAARIQLDEQVPSGPGDVADESVIDTSADYFLNIANSQKKELVEIRNALDRMHRGVFGICESCDEEISLERLRKLPFARLCLDCQASLEKHLRVHRISPFPKL